MGFTDLFSALATTQSGVPVLTFCVLVISSANRRIRMFFAVTWETIAAILGSVVTAGAMLKGVYNTGKGWKQKRDKRKKEDEENREILKGFPQILQRFDEATSQIQQINAGVHANNESLEKLGTELAGLRRDQEYYRKLKEIELDESGVCWYEADDKGHLTSVSQGMCELFGMTQEQMIKEGTGWLTVIEESDLVFQQLERAALNHLPYRATYMITRKGESFFVESRASWVEYDKDEYRLRGSVKKTGVKH